MTDFEVSEPIINPPFDEPRHFWYIREGRSPEKRDGRRPAVVYPPSDTDVKWDLGDGILSASRDYAPGFEMTLVNAIRDRVKAWREQKYPGISRTTDELLKWWKRDGRKSRLFFAQIEAAETVIFLREARPDLLQGIRIPPDMPNEKQVEEGAKAFLRYACKMATGSGKTTVMGMLAAWSILNKLNDRTNTRFSDVVLVLCPTVTIRYRLAELDPSKGEASIYRIRDLVPEHLMSVLTQGKVLIKTWHKFEVKDTASLNDGARVVKTGVEKTTRETVYIHDKTGTARGRRYLTPADFKRQVDAGLLRVIAVQKDRQGGMISATVQATEYLESDAAWIERLLGCEIGNKGNLFVMNDEAHHAYRIRTENDETPPEGEEEDEEYFYREATVWIDGLDRIHRMRGIQFCLDLSATPFFLGRVGQDTNKPFPWVVSDFPLTDAIESGLVKIPQFPLRDPAGESRAKYFNLWKWILSQLTSAERGAQRTAPKPEAVLKYAHHPIAMLAGQWEEIRKIWEQNEDDKRPPVFIVVCKNTRVAKVIYEWIADDKRPQGIPPLNMHSLRNTDGALNTIRVDCKVIAEQDDLEQSKSDEFQWMRRTLDTIGKQKWPADRQGSPVYPPGFEDLAQKLGRPLTPPGHDVRCIVSVGMLTEGWDCTTVTHIIGIRPFMSQLLCEQVVGRGLRRSNYEDFDEEGKYPEEIAKILGVPFEVVPYKAEPQAVQPPREKKYHIHALPEKDHFTIEFPRVAGYTHVLKSRIAIRWDEVPPLRLDPFNIPPEVQMKATLPSNQGRPSLSGPGRTEILDLNPYRKISREQQLLFTIARDLTREYMENAKGEISAHILFPQLLEAVRRYVDNKVIPIPPGDRVDVFMSPYYGYVIESIKAAIRPDASAKSPEIPVYEQHRGPGISSEVEFWTNKDVVPVEKCHLNYAVADTKRWEQSAVYFIDTHPRVEKFIKNQGLGFGIFYFHNGQDHEFVPDFIIHLKPVRKDDEPIKLILETKGFDPLEEIKVAAANRWVNAVNADGKYGTWAFKIAKHPTDIRNIINSF